MNLGHSELFGLADRAVGALGIFGQPLSTSALIELAQRRARLADFGDLGFEAPLGVLVRSYEEEADLGTFGRMAARWDAERFLANLLVLRDAEKRDAAILDQEIRRPIFVTGMPRSGTTFLHELLGQDPANRIVRCWETIYPYPARLGRADDADDRRRKVDRQLAMFARLAPEIRNIHPLSAESAQECTEITGHVFTSMRFDTTHRVPCYRHWLDQTDQTAAYRFHRRFLQHLQHRRGAGTWVLKCPDHVFALRAVRAVYPDARFVFLHRDPVEVLASVAHLTEVLRRPFTRGVDRAEIGQQVVDRWAQGAAILIDELAAGGTSSDTVAHLTFDALVKDPLASVAALYERFGLTVSAELAARVRRYDVEKPRGGYGPRNSRLAEYGLDEATERRRFRHYKSCFGV